MTLTVAVSPGHTSFFGAPMKMAELIAGLDGPVYVERVALYDAKLRNRAKKAIAKALRLQVENKGFAFVEVLGECPTHLGMTPAEAEQWVKEKRAAVFPVRRQGHIENPPSHAPSGVPTFNPARLVEAVQGRLGRSGNSNHNPPV